MGVWVPSVDELLGVQRQERELVEHLRRYPERSRRFLERLQRALDLEHVRLAVAASNLTADKSSAPSTANSTASVSIAAGAIVVVSLNSQTGGSVNPDTPTMTGQSLTWVQLSDFLWQTTGTQRRRSTLFRTYSAAGGSGALSLNYGTAPANIAWSVDQATGADTTGTNGSGAFGSPVTTVADVAAATSGSVSLAALRNASSLAFGAWSHVVASGEQITEGSGFTELADVFTTNANPAQIETEVRTNVTTVNASWLTSALYGGIGVEIKAPLSVVGQMLMLLGMGS